MLQELSPLPPDGFVVAIDKPIGWTSFQVVNKLKWHLKRTFGLKKIKIGHAGTLDPLATGLLLVCVGKATKRIEVLQNGIKEYSGTMVLGATTPCFDLEQTVDVLYPTDQIDEQRIEETRRLFVGEIEQVPPIFSAVKIGGQRAYISARDGQAAEIAPKRVTVYNFDITGYRPATDPHPQLQQPPASVPLKSTATSKEPQLYRNPQGYVPEGLPQVDFHITCSKGTYIRSIARDFGIALDSGAFLASLRRERIGDYHVSQAIALDDIEQILSPDNTGFFNRSTL